MRFLFALLLIFSLAQAEVYDVSDFRGGMNLLDSTDLAPNEALSIKNMVLAGNSLVSRPGWKQWNDSAINTSWEINDCFIYQPTPSFYRLMISCGDFVYKAFLDEPTNTDWSEDAWKYSDTGTVSAGTLFVTDNFWSRLSVNYGDSVYLSSNPSTDFYVKWTSASPSNPTDTTILLSASTGHTDSTNVYFEIWRTFISPSFSQYKDKLYIADSVGGSWGSYEGNFPMVYNDTNYQFLGIIDTGMTTGDGILLIDTSTVVYNTGKVSLKHNTNIVYGEDGADFGDTSAGGDSLVKAGMTFIYFYSYFNPGYRNFYTFSSLISEVVDDSILYLEDIFIEAHPDKIRWDKTKAGFTNYEIRHQLYPCAFFDTLYFNGDSTKNWNDISYGIEFLSTFYAQKATDDSLYTIYCNNDDMFQTRDDFSDSTRYYIYSMFPYGLLLTSNDYQMFPFMYQIMFHKERLWAIGNQYTRYNIGNRWYNKLSNVNTIWYSDPAYPEYIRYNYNFSVGNNEMLTCIFELRGDMYFASANAIWRFSGDPDDGVHKVWNDGFTDRKAWANATNNYGYFANDNGIYQFNGVTAEKISHRADKSIQAFHDKYKNGRLVLGYFDEKLYVSYPDSDVTLYYDVTNDFWSYFNFGMTCIMTEWADKDTSIFLFGNPNYPGRVFYYPSNVYFDSTASDSIPFSVEYLTGHQSYGNYEHTKRINEIAWSVKTNGTASIYVYPDFGVISCDWFPSDSTGNMVYVKPLDNDCVGEYNQIKLGASSGERIVFRGYRVYFSWHEKFYK